MAIVLYLYMGFVLLPILLLFVGSIGSEWFNTMLPVGLTSRWYLDVFADTSFQNAFKTSMIVTFLTCILVTAISVPFAYFLIKTKSKFSKVFMRVLSVLPISVPPLVLGFGYIIVFSSDYLPYLGMTWVLVAAHCVLCVPYMLQTLVSDMISMNIQKLDLAAETVGANTFRRVIDIIVPSIRHSIFSGLITVTAISIGEFQVTNLIAGFLNRTYPVVLLQAFYGAVGFACASTVILLCLALLTSLLSTAVNLKQHMKGSK